MSLEKENRVRLCTLRDLFSQRAIVKLSPILMTADEATDTMVRFDGQTIKAVWDTKGIGSYFILIEGESVVAIRIKGDK